MRTSDYLDAVKAKLNISSDYAMAKALGISRQLASKYLKGKSVPGPLVAYRVAEILGDQPFAVMADFEAERAEHLGNEQEADEWKTIIRKVGNGVAGVLASILLAVGFAFSPNADAGLAVNPSIDGIAHRIALWGWIRRAMRRFAVALRPLLA